MFGYVRPPLALLEPADRERFQRAYCGLCHTLGRRYGSRATMILNYDLTYLSILLSDPKEPDIAEARCISSPIQKRQFFQPTAALEIAADLSVILSYWQLQDGAADHGSVKGLAYRSSAGLFYGAYRIAAERRPSFNAVVRQQLERLSALERERCPSLDAPADTFAQLLAGAAELESDPRRRRVLRELLYHLGRWVYLVDAADDLERDLASGNYNPVSLRYGITAGRLTGSDRADFALTLDHSIHRLAAAYELANFGCWSNILETTFYTGLFQVGKAVLDGTFHTRSQIGGIQRQRSGS